MKQTLPIQWKQLLFSALTPLLFLLLFLCYMGYEFGVGNQLVFLPVIESIDSLSYLKNDFSVISHTDYNPFFNFVFAAASRLIPLPMLFFILQSALILALFVILKKIHGLFFSSTSPFWLSLILLLAWQPQSPDGNVFWANRLEGQYLAWLLISISFYDYLKGSAFRSGFWAGASYLIHFQLGLLSTAALVCANVLGSKQIRFSSLLRFLAGTAVLGLPVFTYFSDSIFHGKALAGALFLDYAHLRMPHHMLWNTRLYCLFLVLLFIPGMTRKIPLFQIGLKASISDPLKRLQWLSISIFVLGSLQYVDYYMGVGYLSRLQFLRLLPFVYVTTIFFIAHALHQAALSPSLWQRTLAVLFIFVFGPRLIAYESLTRNLIFITAASGMFILWTLLKAKRSPFLLIASCLFFTSLTRYVLWHPGHLPSLKPIPWSFDAQQKTNDPWIAICKQTMRLTPKTSLILTPPYLKGFVYYSKRAGFVEFKSGANHEETFKEWKKRLELSMGGHALASCSGESCLSRLRIFYNSLSPSAIEKIQNQYQASFFITESPQNYPYPLVAAKGHFKLYRIEPLPSEAQANPQT